MIIGGLTPNIIGLIIAATSLGAFISFVPASYMADILGRKRCIAVGCCLVIIASAIQVAVTNHWVFFVSRVLAGAGVGTAQTAAPLLTTEIAHPRQRQIATALYNAGWCMGSIASASVTYATLSIAGSWSWRVPCLLQAAYPLSQLAGLYFIPESPRWLVSKNRKEEALAILAKYHANGNADDELVQHEFHQICSNISAENQQPRYWSSFFASKGDMHRLAICVIVGFMQEWAGNGMKNPYSGSNDELLTCHRDHLVLSGPDSYFGRDYSCTGSSSHQHQLANLESTSLSRWRSCIRAVWPPDFMAVIVSSHVDFPLNHDGGGWPVCRETSTGGRSGCRPNAVSFLWQFRYCVLASIHRVSSRDSTFPVASQRHCNYAFYRRGCVFLQPVR